MTFALAVILFIIIIGLFIYGINYYKKKNDLKTKKLLQLYLIFFVIISINMIIFSFFSLNSNEKVLLISFSIFMIFFSALTLFIILYSLSENIYMFINYIKVSNKVKQNKKNNSKSGKEIKNEIQKELKKNKDLKEYLTPMSISLLSYVVMLMYFVLLLKK